MANQLIDYQYEREELDSYDSPHKKMRISHDPISERQNAPSDTHSASLETQSTRLSRQSALPSGRSLLLDKWSTLPDKQSITSNRQSTLEKRPLILGSRQSETSDSRTVMTTKIVQENFGRAIEAWPSASAAQRNFLMLALLTNSSMSELSNISNSINELLKVDFLGQLPIELAFKALFFLDALSLSRCARVCRRWRELADDDIVWHRMCEQHIDRKCTSCGWGLPLLERKRLKAYRRWQKQHQQAHEHKQNYGLEAPNRYPDKQKARAISKSTTDEKLNHDSEQKPEADLEINLTTEPPCASPKYYRPWKDIYSERFVLARNWRSNNYIVRKFKGHSEPVTSVYLDDENKCDSSLEPKSGIIASGSADRTIKIWDVKSGTLSRTLEGHTDTVQSIQFDETILVSGSSDRTVRVWDYKAGKCLSVLKGHTGEVMTVAFDGTLIVSGSSDCTVRVWDFTSKKCNVLRGHTAQVNSVAMCSKSKRIWSASDDSSIKIWSLDDNTLQKSVTAHAGPVEQVLIIPTVAFGHDDCVICSSSMDCTIKIWSNDLSACHRTLFGHLDSITNIAADCLRLVSASCDRTLKIWDIESGECRDTVSLDDDVISVSLSDRRYIYGDITGKFWVHDFSFQNLASKRDILSEKCDSCLVRNDHPYYQRPINRH